MNKMRAQNFLNVFNDLLADRFGASLRPHEKALFVDKSELKDEVDLLNAQQEEQLSTRLSQRNLQFLKKIEAAKAKIDDGSFGICEDCGDDIAQKRLLARPTACLCIECQEAKENLELHNIKHRRDLSASRTVEMDEQIEEESVQKFGNFKEIKFESVVDL